MTDVIIIDEARTELFQAVSFYEEKSEGLGIDFHKQIRHSIEIINRYPECCPLRNDETRRLLINRFPYLIIYTIEYHKIWIIAFAHCKRKSGYWKKRLDK